MITRIKIIQRSFKKQKKGVYSLYCPFPPDAAMERFRESRPFRSLNSARAYVPTVQGDDMEAMMTDLIIGEVAKEITRVEEEAVGI